MNDSKRDIDICVFIGRFRPFHNGHMSVVKHALSRASYVHILVGSCGEPRSQRNPFTFSEVYEMIMSSLHPDELHRVEISPTYNSSYSDEMWVQHIQEVVNAKARFMLPSVSFPRISLIGYAKDHTSYYLKLFPQWLSINVPQHQLLSATSIRDHIFGTCPLSGNVDELVPAGTFSFIKHFVQTLDYSKLLEEAAFLAKERKAYETLPYPPIFVTTDAVVVQSGHVLLIRRGNYPGKGLWALPGGYVNANEKISDCWYRELKEETGLELREDFVRSCMVASQVFDDPHRDDRGRMITHAHMVHLPPGPLPAIKGGDDASEARWVQLGALKRDQVFADHYAIIKTMLAKSVQF